MPNYTHEELPFFPDVEASVRLIAKDTSTHLTDTVNRAMQVLGVVDACMMAGQPPLYMSTNGKYREINLDTIGCDIDMGVSPVVRTVKLVDRALHSLRAYTEAREVSKEIAVMHGAYLLDLVTQDKLAVRSSRFGRRIDRIRIV